MRLRPQRIRLTVEQISFPLGVHMKEISFAQAKKVSEIKHVYGVRTRNDKRGVESDFRCIAIRSARAQDRARILFDRRWRMVGHNQQGKHK